MAKRRRIDQREFKALRKALPQSDKDFINGMLVILEAIVDETLRYEELPRPMERVLHAADRDTLFSVLTECLGLLLDAPVMERLKRARHRNGKPVPAKAEKRDTVRPTRTRPKAKRSRSK